jgi:hypothetical protein
VQHGNQVRPAVIVDFKGKRHFSGTSVLVGFPATYDKSGNKLFERALHVESRASIYNSYDSMNRLLDYRYARII